MNVEVIALIVVLLVAVVIVYTFFIKPKPKKKEEESAPPVVVTAPSLPPTSNIAKIIQQAYPKENASLNKQLYELYKQRCPRLLDCDLDIRMKKTFDGFPCISSKTKINEECSDLIKYENRFNHPDVEKYKPEYIKILKDAEEQEKKIDSEPIDYEIKLQKKWEISANTRNNPIYIKWVKDSTKASQAVRDCIGRVYKNLGFDTCDDLGIISKQESKIIQDFNKSSRKD